MRENSISFGPLELFSERHLLLKDGKPVPVCTENLSSGVVVVKSAKDGV
jgi:hypothetical protein